MQCYRSPELAILPSGFDPPCCGLLTSRDRRFPAGLRPLGQAANLLQPSRNIVHSGDLLKTKQGRHCRSASNRTEGEQDTTLVARKPVVVREASPSQIIGGASRLLQTIFDDVVAPTRRRQWNTVRF